MRDSEINQKQPVMKEITALLGGTSSTVVVDYRGLTVEQDTQLRKQLRGVGVVYKVYKNTMVRIAARGTDSGKFDTYPEGPMALAVSKDDATVAARVLAKLAKTAPKLEVKDSIIEGAAYDAKRVAAIVAVPPGKELLGRPFGSIQSPITNFVYVIKQVAEKDAAPATE